MEVLRAVQMMMIGLRTNAKVTVNSYEVIQIKNCAVRNACQKDLVNMPSSHLNH